MSHAENELAFHLDAHKIEYEREFRFHSERKWRSDFFVKPDLLLEVEGGIWMKGGAHSLPSNIERDIEKQNAAVLLGYRPLRFTPQMVKKGLAIESVVKALAND